MSQQPTIHLFGVPLDLGAGRRGVDMGPSALRIAGLGDRLGALGYDVRDGGDVPTPNPETRSPGDPRQKYVADIGEVCTLLFERVLAALDAGGLPIVLGGDHSVAAGSVSASAAHWRRQDAATGLIWVDAHGDINTPQTSTSGNVHGMPLAALLGEEPAALSSIGGFVPKVRPEHTVLVGVRNLDEQEKAAIRRSRVHVFTMKEIDRLGIATVASRAIELASAGTNGIHVSFDVDVCDPSIAPGVGTPVRGGLNYREAHFFMETVSDSGLLRALDIVEVNPVLDVRNSTAALGVELALSALGKAIL